MNICLIMNGQNIEKARVCEYTRDCERFYAESGLEFFSPVVEEPLIGVYVFHRDKYIDMLSMAQEE